MKTDETGISRFRRIYLPYCIPSLFFLCVLCVLCGENLNVPRVLFPNEFSL